MFSAVINVMMRNIKNDSAKPNHHRLKKLNWNNKKSLEKNKKTIINLWIDDKISSDELISCICSYSAVSSQSGLLIRQLRKQNSTPLQDEGKQ